MRLSKIIILTVFCVMSFSSCQFMKNLFTGSAEKQSRGKGPNEIYMKAMDMYENKRYEKAMNFFDLVENAYQGHPRIDTIKFYKANCLYFTADYIGSSNLYQEYQTQMGRGAFTDIAGLYYALSLYKVSPDVELDQTFTKRAISAFTDYMYRYPDSQMTEECLEYIDELNQRVYKNEVSIAHTYFNIGYFKASRVTLQNILKKNPSTPYREEIMFRIVKSNYEYARTSVPSKRKERFYDTIDAFYNFVDEYPASEYLKEAKKLHTHAHNYSEGTAAINEVTGRVISTKLKIYDKRDEMAAKLEKYNRKGNVKAAKKAKDVLDVYDKAIAEYEKRIEERKRDVKINQK